MEEIDIEKKKIALVGNTQYTRYEYSSEAELQEFVYKSIEHIFGKNCILLPKTKISSAAGISSIPDGFVLDILGKKWYILEIEMWEHDYKHIFNQLDSFFFGDMGYKYP